jgi:hypothetical protein
MMGDNNIVRDHAGMIFCSLAVLSTKGAPSKNGYETWIVVISQLIFLLLLLPKHLMKPTVSKKQWLDWIDEQEKSSLSIAAFCCNKKINTDNFYYHRGPHRKKFLPASSTFVRAQLVYDSALITSQPNMTLCVGRSRLHVSANVSPEWLSALMASLA